MNTRSIHIRLISWYTVLIICASSAFGAYAYFSLRTHLYEQLRGTLARRVEHIAFDIMPKTDAEPGALKQEIEQLYSPEQSGRFIRITRKDGAVVYESGPPHDGSFDISRIRKPDMFATADCGRAIPNAGKGLLVVGCSAALHAPDASYAIEMGAPVADIEGFLHKLIVTLLIGLSVVAFVTIAGGSFLVRRALQPVEAIRATAEQITFSNLRQRLPAAATGDAIEHLSRTLNQMLDRLDQAYQQASRFSADASHELRTPLAIMRSELESMLHSKDLPAEMRERLVSTLEETESLSNIVEGLFAIARLDAGEAKIGHESVDLAALVNSTLEQMSLLADEKRISVRVDAPQSVYARGDAVRLKQVIVNLLDNAIKYTMGGGAIAFSVSTQPSRAVLQVKDNGIGISSEALPHVFERFYRADKVRSRVQQGAGLGLSIVRAICQAHGGTVHLHSAEGVGTTVTVELPLAEPAMPTKTSVAA